MQEVRDMQVRFPGSGGSPGKENSDPIQYSSLENSMTEEPGGLQFMGSQRIRHDRAHLTNTHSNLRKYPTTSGKDGFTHHTLHLLPLTVLITKQNANIEIKQASFIIKCNNSTKIQ